MMCSWVFWVKVNSFQLMKRPQLTLILRHYYIQGIGPFYVIWIIL
jgi:hypothetical protein